MKLPHFRDCSIIEKGYLVSHSSLPLSFLDYSAISTMFEDILSESQRVVASKKWNRTNNRLLIVAAVSAVINVLGFVFFLYLITEEALGHSDTTSGVAENVIGSSVVFLLLIPIGCTILAGLISLIPFKQWAFLKRVQRVLMILLVGFEGILSLLVLAAIFIEVVVNT